MQNQRETTQYQYDRLLLENARKHIEPMAEFIVGTDLTEPISLEIRKRRTHNELRITHREHTLIYILLGRELLCAGTFENFSKEPLYADIQTFFSARLNTLSKMTSGKVKIRNSPLEKNLKKYLSVSSKKDITIQCAQFCANARLLLTMKNLGLKSEAIDKKDSLYWLATKTAPPQSFRLEDYWFYEQETGVNLSIEIAAVLDKLYDEYKRYTSSAQDMCWSVVEDIICFCIEENYRYIANIPATNWKISIMKIACTIIGKELIDALLRNQNSTLRPLASEIASVGMLTPKKNAAGKKISLQDYLQLLVLQKLSTAFNQVLSACIMCTLDNTSIFSRKSKLTNKKAWLKGAGFVFPDEKCDKVKLRTQLEEYEADKQTMYENLARRKDTLIFCNSDDSFVKAYIDDLADFIQLNNSIFDEVDTQEDTIRKEKISAQIYKLRQASLPRNKRAKRLVNIQRAIRIAIDARES